MADDHASLAALADLARAGFLIARQSLMQVNFEVHHIRDRTGYLRELFEQKIPRARTVGSTADARPSDGDDPLAPEEAPRETLSTAANGVGLVIGTYAGALPRVMQSRHQGSDLPVALRVDHVAHDLQVFQGTAWPNPTFIYESAQRFEGLILIEDDTPAWSSFQPRAIAELVAEISRTATEHEAPLLSVQSPAQMPAGAEPRDWPVPSAVALRFSMALRGAGSKRRLALAKTIADFADQRGYGFWLADSRVGYRQGNWYLVSPYQGRKVEKQARRRSSGKPTFCLPVTFVGPARVGSTSAIMSYLREFPELGVLACSIISLDDLAFIHLQLAVNEMPRGGVEGFAEELRRQIRSAHGDDVEGRTNAPQDILPRILPLLTGNRVNNPDRETAAGLTERAGDYQTLTGPPLPVWLGSDTDRIPLWFSWRAVGPDGLVVPLTAFMKALEAVVLAPSGADRIEAAPNLDYLVCRDVGESTLRGRGKITLPRNILGRHSDTKAEVLGARISTSLEDAWRAELSRDTTPGGVEVSVAWVEYRLNNSSTL